MADTQGWQF